VIPPPTSTSKLRRAGAAGRLGSAGANGRAVSMRALEHETIDRITLRRNQVIMVEGHVV